MSYETLGIAMLLGASAMALWWVILASNRHYQRRRHINSVHEGIERRLRERRERRES